MGLLGSLLDFVEETVEDVVTETVKLPARAVKVAVKLPEKVNKAAEEILDKLEDD